MAQFCFFWQFAFSGTFFGELGKRGELILDPNPFSYVSVDVFKVWSACVFMYTLYKLISGHRLSVAYQWASQAGFAVSISVQNPGARVSVDFSVIKQFLIFFSIPYFLYKGHSRIFV